jgi:Kdo2-lipid IVA lauroyltransferase/acyltransferase
VVFHRPFFYAPGGALEKPPKRIHKIAMARWKTKTAVGRFFYRLRYRIAEYTLRGVVAIVPWIPYRLLVLFGFCCARATFGLLWQYRRRMEKNVAQALGGEISKRSQRRALIWGAWKNFARGMLETCAVMHFSKERVISTVVLSGEEHLKHALAKGKGVLALSAHLGTFTMIGARLAASGYPFSVVVKHPGDDQFARLIDDYRTQLGMQSIAAKPRREAVRGILKALRQNRIVLVIADEFKSGGVMVDFLGQRLPAPRGPATLALRTGAVVLPMFATRQVDGSLRLSIEPQIEPVELDDLEQSVLATTALFTRHLERAIRQHPDQWNWLGFPRSRSISRSTYSKAAPPPSDLSHAESDSSRVL